jgi:hypothetical protein
MTQSTHKKGSRNNGKKQQKIGASIPLYCRTINVQRRGKESNMINMHMFLDLFTQEFCF